MNTIKLGDGPTCNTPSSKGGTERNVDEGVWINIGLTLVQGGNVREEEYLDIDEDSMIVTFRSISYMTARVWL